MPTWSSGSLKWPPKFLSFLHSSKEQTPLCLANSDLNILNTRTLPSSLLLVYYCEANLSSWHLCSKRSRNPWEEVTMAFFLLLLASVDSVDLPCPTSPLLREYLHSDLSGSPDLSLSSPLVYHRTAQNIFIVWNFLFWNSNRKSRTINYRAVFEKRRQRKNDNFTLEDPPSWTRETCSRRIFAEWRNLYWGKTNEGLVEFC